MTLKDTCSMLPTLGNYNTGHYNNNRFVKSRNLDTFVQQSFFRVYTNSSSPGPAGDSGLYNGHTGHNTDNSSYVTANSPQPNTFPAIPINRVSNTCLLSSVEFEFNILGSSPYSCILKWLPMNG